MLGRVRAREPGEGGPADLEAGSDWLRLDLKEKFPNTAARIVRSPLQRLLNAGSTYEDEPVEVMRVARCGLLPELHSVYRDLNAVRRFRVACRVNLHPRSVAGTRLAPMDLRATGRE